MRTTKASILLMLLLLLLASGCSSFNPRALEDVGFEQRALSKTDGGVEVAVVALSEDEAKGAMGVDLARTGIQPVWIKIRNHESIGFVVPPIVIDHDYFSPTEAAWQVHGWFTDATTDAHIDEHLLKLRLPLRVGPGETISGFVFTNLDKGVKYVNIECVSSGALQVRRFVFLAEFPASEPITREQITRTLRGRRRTTSKRFGIWMRQPSAPGSKRYRAVFLVVIAKLQAILSM
jgi:hypothetical protein